MGRHRAQSAPLVPTRSLLAASMASVAVLTVSGAMSSPPASNADVSPPADSTEPQVLTSAETPLPTPVSPEKVTASELVIVQTGDSLDSIARLHSTDWMTLWRRNLDKVKNPARVFPGQSLSLVAPVRAVPAERAVVAPVAVVVPAPAIPASSPSTAARREKRSTAAEASVSGLVEAARSFVGTPYRFGGKSAKGVDCSGLVFLALQKAGLGQPYRTSGALREWADSIPKSQARAGDLVFGPGHVGIYLGDGMMIDAPHTGTTVGVHKVYSTMTSYGRLSA